MSHYDTMDASDEGQLKSSGEDFVMSGDDDDNDSLDIKPPQATRDSSSGRRKEKSSHKEKKRSREKRHKERHSSGGGSGRERDKERAREREHEHLRERKSGGIELTDRERRDHHRERRSNPERSHMHGHSRSYERASGDDGASSVSLLSNNDHRYQKHYDGSNNYHHQSQQHHAHHQQQQQQHYVQQQYHSYQVHMQRQRQDYYERSTQQQSYHQSGGNSGEYHHHSSSTSSSRHQSSYAKHSHNDHGDYDAIDVQRDRRNYVYEKQPQQPSQKDPESLEQDLRSRLLSKRHKYVKGTDDDEVYESRAERKEAERASKRSRLEEHISGSVSAGERSDRERSKADKHHQQKREKLRDNVIEVLDSPEQTHTRRKHKRHSKEVPAPPPIAVGAPIPVSHASAEKRKTPDDPELLARRAKFLAAEREKEQRKESAREELEARREKRRERKDVLIDALSPSAVAASVTAGLHVVKRKGIGQSAHADVRKKRSKRAHKADDAQEYSEDEDDDSDEEEDGENDDEDDSTSSGSSEQSDVEDISASETHSDDEARHVSTTTGSSKTKSRKRHSRGREENVVDDDDDDLHMVINDSPLSIGEIEKSPVKRKAKRHKKQRHRSKHVSRKARESGLEDEHENVLAVHSDHSHTPPSRSGTHSNSASRSPSPTRSRSQHTARHSHNQDSHRHHRSRSRSRSYTHSSRSVSRSPKSRSRQQTRSNTRSRSRSSSGTRSEERGMKAFQQRAAADVAAGVEPVDDELAKRKSLAINGIEEDEPLCDEKGVQLPNYYPGVQGCRSVEEFQCLNRIEEGTYGVVYRAKDKRTNEIVALKRLKMEKEKEGFPITSLREINTLLKGQHPNIVTVREIVVGSNMDKIFIVMDYVEHDLKSLMETMKNRKQSFFPGEVKCLTQQLLRAVSHLHDNWILHRDLKTSNLLLSHKGILKVGDFGLAREYGSPLKKYTSLVVTLWYRAPELLLCAPEYSTPIDVWSVGCIFAEFLQMMPLFPGKAEIDQLNKIFKELGTPNEKIWPGYQDLPAVKNVLSQNPQFTDYPVSNLRKRFMDKTTELGISLLQGLLTYDPKQRLNARAALKHPYFRELPLPIDPSMFPTWPAKSELGARKALGSSPKPPSGGSQFKQLGREDLAIGAGVSVGKMVSGIITGNKKTAANTGFVLNAGIDQRQLAMGPGFSLKF